VDQRLNAVAGARPAGDQRHPPHNGQRALSSSLHTHTAGAARRGAARGLSAVQPIFAASFLCLDYFLRNPDYIYLNERNIKYIHALTRYSQSVSSPTMETAAREADQADRLADEE